ncbi:SDR family NAD(P)-dependent oxidoreductase [Novosphingobium sp. B 225]|uniref:SDR family NAD(P)-dependent oxidoreductase n=1 Tax=Novosphingobium sp. B 225 TaxID=1961849 RepID=UPI000B4ACC1F|nr:SDR family NAD(P)-dependent oxidoreductase [Novosphingobium sp. B 225]
MTPPQAFDLSGRTVLVTGASSGLGAEFVRALAASGAAVVAAARRKDRLDALVAEIAARGGRAVAVEMDATSEASTIAAFDTAEAPFGPVDSVVANAGASGEGSALDMSVEAFDAHLALNVRGVFLTAREGARRMRAAGSAERRHGRVVIISSVTASGSARAPFAYCTSKAAVSRMGEVLAREWVRVGINVNVLLPGYILTEMNAPGFATDAGKRLIETFPRRRLMEAKDLLPLLLFLCSDASEAVTGSSFKIDDGQTG